MSVNSHEAIKDIHDGAHEMKTNVLVDDVDNVVVIKTPWKRKPYNYIPYAQYGSSIKRYLLFYKLERRKKKEEEAKLRGCIYCGLYYEEGCNCGWRDW